MIRNSFNPHNSSSREALLSPLDMSAEAEAWKSQSSEGVVCIHAVVYHVLSVDCGFHLGSPQVHLIHDCILSTKKRIFSDCLLMNK